MANKKITELMAGTPTRDSLIESAIDISGTMDSRKVKAGVVADLNNIIVAEEYDDTRTYVYGEYRINEGVLYRCTTPINVAEAWTSAHWTAVMVTGEYKRVRIMTKAQFDLLSNDEKDGFIYVSDYPTKIQDIDNVNLNTSDNNKLLGVSVSGSDISVGAVKNVLYREETFSNLTASGSYVFDLKANVLSWLGATEICSLMITGWSSIGAIVFNVVYETSSDKIRMIYPNGTSFSNASITVKIGYKT